MVIVCNREYVPAGLSTMPMTFTYGSMTWTFCSGVTISSCRPSVAKRSKAYRVETSEPAAAALRAEVAAYPELTESAV